MAARVEGVKLISRHARDVQISHHQAQIHPGDCFVEALEWNTMKAFDNKTHLRRYEQSL